MTSRAAMMIALGGWLYACVSVVVIKTKTNLQLTHRKSPLSTAWACTLIAVLLECVHLAYVWLSFAACDCEY